MNRRHFLGMASSAVAAGTLANAPLAAAQKSSARNADHRPNFLFFIADDLMFRTIGSLTNPEVHTPNIDRLAARGCAFTHCFHQGSWTGAVCVASRTMLNTGLTTFKAHAISNENQAGDVATWGQTLRAAGYDTYITGKWHLDAVFLQRSFAEQGPVGPGYLPSTSDMYNRPAPGNHWDPANEQLKGHWLMTSLVENEKPGRIEHSSSLYADAAVEHLTTQVAHRQTPFFMYVGFNAPHDPRQAPQEFLDMYPVDKIAIPPNFLPEHPFDQGEHKTRDELLAPFPRTELDVQTHRREYYAIITHMDRQIGRILDALEASGKAGNTYVILTADHGLAVGEHGLMGKQNQYECSMRMPLILAGPTIPRGKRVDEMVYQHSMFATTCELAGVSVPETVGFPSLVPMLHGEPQPMYDAMFGWLEAVQRSVRTKTHKLIYYPKIERYQLFDLAQDPWEMHDLSDDPQHDELKLQLVARLRAMQQELGDTITVPDPPRRSASVVPAPESCCSQA
ncbi:sulfatase-like hydrolase/transferase [Silvibacterium dinghuense]|uniref:DUF4976 domain-containing protein n=1 Tax=Silvibacterium dinghuense TaxID=1560006 RepID=A0A4Q1SAE8_9BACT|nr:sulfatase-like hydrolase/transferase [Silvibacterium dinghuense]RXS93885.1 DUF4976 domain-containing protein [Silvibacterium dinghuense]GGH08476.1 choline-sulfatase [Silvibacterium dinghuense]